MRAEQTSIYWSNSLTSRRPASDLAELPGKVRAFPIVEAEVLRIEGIEEVA